MPKTVQEFVARNTVKAAENIITVANSLPVDKRNWRPNDKGRSAVDQLAECALTNQFTIELIKNGTWAISDWDEWEKVKNELAGDWDKTIALLKEQTQLLADEINKLPTDTLDQAVVMPWETTDMSNVINYCVWNMSYHEGQITYITTLL